MNSSPPKSGAGSPASAWNGLKWWHWLLFLLPTVVTVITTKVLMSWYQSQETHGTPSLSGVGALLYGFSAGGVGCVLCGIVLGMAMPVRNRVMACIGWTLLCALTTLPASYAVLSILAAMAGR